MMAEKALRILLLEDSEDDAHILLRELQRGGYETVAARVETAEALEDALQRQTWDVVLADYVMPQFGALTGLELLKKRNQDLPFIIISGAIGEETAVDALRAGAHDFVKKGNLSRLFPAIERELRWAQDRQERRWIEAERERLLTENQRQRRVLETLVEINPDGLAIVGGAERRFYLANPAYRAMTPFPAIEPLHKRFDEIWPNGTGSPPRTVIDHVLETGEPVSAERFEVRFPDDSTHFFTYHLRKIPWNGDNGVLIVLSETPSLLMS